MRNDNTVFLLVLASPPYGAGVRAKGLVVILSQPLPLSWPATQVIPLLNLPTIPDDKICLDGVGCIARLSLLAPHALQWRGIAAIRNSAIGALVRGVLGRHPTPIFGIHAQAFHMIDVFGGQPQSCSDDFSCAMVNRTRCAWNPGLTCPTPAI